MIRYPRVGDAVTFIRRRGDGFDQFAAQVVRFYEVDYGMYPALSLVFWNTLAAPQGFFSKPGARWEQTDYVLHRDHWQGDDFGEYWCWPDQAQLGDFYTA